SLARGMCMPSFTFSSVNSAVPSFPTRRSSALGRTPDGQVLLADELLTPDSSRFWPADAWQPGRPQHSLDKQFVRDWAASTGWDKDRKSTRLNSSHVKNSYAVFCLKKKNDNHCS